MIQMNRRRGYNAINEVASRPTAGRLVDVLSDRQE